MAYVGTFTYGGIVLTTATVIGTAALVIHLVQVTKRYKAAHQVIEAQIAAHLSTYDSRLTYDSVDTASSSSI